MSPYSTSIPTGSRVVYDAGTPAGSVIEALYSLQDAQALFRCRMRELLDLGANELGALQYLARVESAGRSARPRDISKNLGVTSAATTILLGRLVDRGFVTRRADPVDGRGQLLRLTDDAHSRLSGALGDSRSGLAARLAALTPREAKRVVVLLGAVTDSLARSAPLPA
jgi:DNA-binding MarR family transcriptional regulator